MLTFLPRSQWDLLRHATVPLWRVRVHVTSFYFFLNVGVAAAVGVGILLFGFRGSMHLLRGPALDTALLVFLWPLARNALRGTSRVRWSGVSIWAPGTPRWLALVPLFALFFGLNPYLGLRTAGTYTMFSNLQVERDRSNHLLLGSNPLKVWHVQDDSVRILRIDPRHAERRQDDLTGNLLPAVELQKRIIDWHEQGIDRLFARFVYEGRTYETQDLWNSNPWGARRYGLPHYLLDFRLVQRSEPVICRW